MHLVLSVHQSKYLLGKDNKERILMAKVAVLGAGSWGTALSIVLADNGHDVRLWTHRKQQADAINTTHKNEKYLEIMVPEQIKAFHDLKEAVTDTDAVVIVVPTKAIREQCRQLNDTLKHTETLLHTSKGIEPELLKRVSQ